MCALWYITPRALVNASNPQRPWVLAHPRVSHAAERKLGDQRMDRAVVDRRARILVDNISVAKDIVIASDALSATLPILIDLELQEASFVFLPIELPWLRLNYGFVSRRARTPSPAAKAFKELVLMIERERYPLEICLFDEA
jgi:DNA-binding transcriptional LysR family regulator